MFKSISRFLNKRKTMSIISYSNDFSSFMFGRNVDSHVDKSASIELGGNLFFGFPLSGIHTEFAHNQNTVLTMAENSKLIIKGDVHIAPGCTIKISKNGLLELSGKNVIAHNSTIIASKLISIGEGASISWGVNLIDDDHHSFYKSSGIKIKRIRKTLIIGSNVGIQMNVCIPAGGKIGNNSIIAANTVLREDVPENTLIYTNNSVKKINNITTGFQFP